MSPRRPRSAGAAALRTGCDECRPVCLWAYGVSQDAARRGDYIGGLDANARGAC